MRKSKNNQNLRELLMKNYTYLTIEYQSKNGMFWGFRMAILYFRLDRNQGIRDPRKIGIRVFEIGDCLKSLMPCEFEI